MAVQSMPRTDMGRVEVTSLLQALDALPSGKIPGSRLFRDCLDSRASLEASDKRNVCRHCRNTNFVPFT
jgi:hypothetical protein